MKVDKYIYDKLVEWKDTVVRHSDSKVFINDIKSLPGVVQDWIYFDYNEDGEYVVNTSATEINSRLVAVIRWIEDDKVFEAKKPKKWVVRSKELNANGDNHYGVLAHFGDIAEMNYFSYDAYNATKFDTKEEAESWTNAHQEVIEVEE